MIRRGVLATAAAVALLFGLGGPAAAEGKKLIFALPGIPPVFSSVIAFVADKEGFFKKEGVDVELRPFDTGTAAARAVVAGDIDFAISPSPLVINQISNAGVNLVAIWGFPRPDWLIGSVDPKRASCQDMVGQPVGVDAVGAARSIALKEMLSSCGVKINEVQQVALSSNIAPALIAGRLTFGVLHLDDVPVIDEQGKHVTTVTSLEKTNPNSHYLLGVARVDRLKENRDAYVRLLAAIMEAGRFMEDPRNADKVAADAAPTGRSASEAKASLKKYLDLGFWAVDNDGLDKGRIEAVVATQQKIGNIQPGKTPVTYDRLTDRSVWRDAAAMAKKQGG
jgi:ABC-type nitrate/sulfonate/bicarbonate transport system substrate-binding protein